MADSPAVGQLLAQAAVDRGVAARLIENHRAQLSQAGVDLPSTIAVHVYKNDATTMHAVLPVEMPGELDAARRVNPTAAKVFERAWRDAAFKSRLMASPRQAFVETTGLTPPSSLKLVAHENTPTSINLVIPYIPTSELSDADLERVAGGKGDSGCSTSVQVGYSLVGAAPEVAAANLGVGGAVGAVGALTMLGGGLASAFK
jgi:hypothetical protein